jgi:tRNA(Ile2) C34 agmatinyltransferase TiaS
MYAKVCQQCGVAMVSKFKQTRRCESCARAYREAAKAAAIRRANEVYHATRIPCVCGRRLIGIHFDYDRCSECRRELAAKRRQTFAVPRAIGESRRLLDVPKRRHP